MGGVTRSSSDLVSTTNHGNPYAIGAHEFAETFTVVSPGESGMTAANTLQVATEEDDTPLLLKVGKPLNRLLAPIACDKSPAAPLSMLATDLGTYNAEFTQFLANTTYSDEVCASDW